MPDPRTRMGAHQIWENSNTQVPSRVPDFRDNFAKEGVAIVKKERVEGQILRDLNNMSKKMGKAGPVQLN